MELFGGRVLPKAGSSPGLRATGATAFAFIVDGHLPLVPDGLFDAGVLGLHIDMGLSGGYASDENYTGNARGGLGFSLRLGPIFLAPSIGAGVESRGGAMDSSTLQTPLEGYLYPGVRMRVAGESFGVEVWGETFALALGDEVTPRHTRWAARLFYVDQDAGLEYSAGARWMHWIDDFLGADVDRPSGHQVGATLGLGFAGVPWGD